MFAPTRLVRYVEAIVTPVHKAEKTKQYALCSYLESVMILHISFFSNK